MPASAQTSAPPTQAASPSADELKDLISTLENDKARGDFVAKLKVLLQAKQATAKNEPQTADNWLSAFSGELRLAVGRVAAAGAAVDLLEFVHDLREGATSDLIRERTLEALGKIAIILAVAFVASFVVGWSLARPRRAIEERQYATVWVRTIFLLLRAALDVLPIAAFVGAGLLTAGLIHPRRVADLVALALINGWAVTEAVLICSRILLAPNTPNLRLLPMAAETSNYLYIWVARIAYVTLYGYFILEAGLLLGMSREVYAVLVNVLGILIAALLIIFVLQNRDTVAARLRGDPDARQSWAVLRRPIAAVWHLLAIFYVVALYLVLAVRGNAGTIFIVRATVLTAIALGLGWAIDGAVQALAKRGFRLNDDQQQRYPGLQARVNRYTFTVNVVLRALLIVVLGAVVLEAWGLRVFAWVASPMGQKVITAATDIAVILALAMLTWDLVSALIERQLTQPAITGRAISTRAKTLLPLARNVLRLVLIILVTMVVLAEIGVNITPLLAGAGFVGLAVGFGAQKLVQDVITGWFILMEDTISVGDVVDVGGHAGLVERINIRTLALRDGQGAVHVIPFSSVTTVKNQSRDHSYFQLDIRLAYEQPVEPVIAIAREIDAELRADPDLGSLFLGPLEINGIERFEDAAYVLRVRVRTRPTQNGKIGYAFNLRLRQAFERQAIRLPRPVQTVYYARVDGGGEDAGEAAPLPK
jgi:small conductance mechanosensitive channel